MNPQNYFNNIEGILRAETPLLDEAVLRAFVRRFIEAKERYIEAADCTPVYLVDVPALTRRAIEFRDAFLAVLPQVTCFYAMKSNDHPAVITSVVRQGYGLDVSSGRELGLALGSEAREIIFSGPGKTDEELLLACRHADRVILLLDSFGELARLERVAPQVFGGSKGRRIRAGVRLMIEEEGLWRKFGIPLREVPRFVEAAAACDALDLCGFQFHASWNLDARKQTAFLERLGGLLADLAAPLRSRITFLDIGGGYWPPDGEWIQPSATPEGQVKKIADPRLTEGLDHRWHRAAPITDFVKELDTALRRYVFPYVDCAVHLEPGRWISHEAMHILLKVMDKKADDVVIVDGGINMVGWERYEADYFPVINLSQPGLDERECTVFGSLCTPHDLWGYSYFGTGIREGDILLVPVQGAYTYSLRQEFIKGIPGSAILGESGPDPLSRAA